MQIVINVPDKTYEYYVKLSNKSDEQLSAHERLILNGIPLPKGHGRLIDADKIGLTGFECVMCNGDYKEALKMYIEKVEKAPTVLEADKAGNTDDRSRLQKM